MKDDEAQDVFAPGDVIEERYRIIGLVGKGGMGEVYEAEIIATGERVAIKTVLPSLLSSKKTLARFELECEHTQRISHPGVLRIIEVFKTPRPRVTQPEMVPCMVMEFLVGETLADRMVDGRWVGPDEAVSLTCQMAAALTAAHRAGVVHRDLKPDNVFLAPDGDKTRVVLTDFGVARQSAAPSDDGLTASNVLLGTPDYMAPEQLELEDAMPASDIYTMGLVIFEMIIGQPPFVADTPLKTVFKRIQEDPPSPLEFRPDLGPRWETVILRCLARQPEDRFAEAQDVIRILEGNDSEWLQPNLSDRLRKFLPWLAGLVLLVGAAAAWWLL
ncbi:MAG: serine/threonine-protein kinase [Acidobacteriota bacterium]